MSYSCINYYDKVYPTKHQENLCIMKDSDDNALVLVGPFNENTKLITIGLISSFSSQRQKHLRDLFGFEKAKNEF